LSLSQARSSSSRAGRPFKAELRVSSESIIQAPASQLEHEIAAFGGNSQRVMIVGESAGGLNVCALLATPTAALRLRFSVAQNAGAAARPTGVVAIHQSPA